MTKSRSGELPGTATHRQVTDAAPPSRLAAVRALALALLAFAAAAALIALWPGGALILIGDAPRKRSGRKELYRQQPWLALPLTGIIGFPVIMVAALLLLIAAMVANMSGN